MEVKQWKIMQQYSGTWVRSNNEVTGNQKLKWMGRNGNKEMERNGKNKRRRTG